MSLQLPTPSPLGKSKTKSKRTTTTKRQPATRKAAPKKTAAPKRSTASKKAAPRKGAKRTSARGTRKIFTLRKFNTKKVRKTWGKFQKTAGQHLRQYAGVWIVVLPLLWFLGPHLLTAGVRSVGTMLSSAGGGLVSAADTLSANLVSSGIAPLFTPEVDYWSGNITRWSGQYSIDPNLLATVMQIESCGHPSVSSYAGAQGLFQVMPTYFTSSENQLDPDTNAMRGANVLNSCLEAANGDEGLALACYNGGQSVINSTPATWSEQTQRYYYWGTGIYADAQRGGSSSDTLNRWLDAGGSSLCQQASVALGLSIPTN